MFGLGFVCFVVINPRVCQTKEFILGFLMLPSPPPGRRTSGGVRCLVLAAYVVFSPAAAQCPWKVRGYCRESVAYWRGVYDPVVEGCILYDKN